MWFAKRHGIAVVVQGDPNLRQRSSRLPSIGVRGNDGEDQLQRSSVPSRRAGTLGDHSEDNPSESRGRPRASLREAP